MLAKHIYMGNKLIYVNSSSYKIDSESISVFLNKTPDREENKRLVPKLNSDRVLRYQKSTNRHTSNIVFHKIEDPKLFKRIAKQRYLFYHHYIYKNIIVENESLQLISTIGETAYFQKRPDDIRNIQGWLKCFEASSHHFKRKKYGHEINMIVNYLLNNGKNKDKYKLKLLLSLGKLGLKFNNT